MATGSCNYTTTYPYGMGPYGTAASYGGGDLGAHTPASYPMGYGQAGMGLPYPSCGIAQGAHTIAQPYPFSTVMPPMAYPTIAPITSYPIATCPPISPIGGMPMPPTPPTPGAVGGIVQSVTEMIRRIGMIIRDAGKILGAFIDIWAGTLDKAQQALALLASTYGGWIARFGQWLYMIRQHLATWMNMTAQQFTRLIDTIICWLQALPAQIQAWLNWLSSTLSMQITPVITEAVRVISDFLTHLISSLRELATAVAAAAQRIMGSVGEWLSELPQLLAATWAQLHPQFAACWNAIITILKEFWQQLVTWLCSLPEMVMGS